MPLTWESALKRGTNYKLASYKDGIHLPQRFIQSCDEDWLNTCDPGDVESVRNGPDDEYYADAWNNILDSARYFAEDHRGVLQEYGLYEDGDLYAINLEEEIIDIGIYLDPYRN